MNCRKCGKSLDGVEIKEIPTKYGLKKVVNCPYCMDGKYATANWINDKEPKESLNISDSDKLDQILDILTQILDILTKVFK